VSHYKTLGVPPDADRATIKKAYRRKAKEHHNDRTGGDDKKMAEIKVAYAVVSDPARRSAYDAGVDPSEVDQVKTILHNIITSWLGSNNPDFVSFARDFVKQARRRMKEAESACARTLKQLAGKRKAAKFKGKGANMLELVIGHKELELEEKLRAIKAEMEVSNQVMERIDEYESLVPEESIKAKHAKTLDQMFAAIVAQQEHNRFFTGT